MTWEQVAILVVLAGTLAVFVWDRWRYDVVAITSLMVCILLGLIDPEAAFAGFSNPAVITVAAVLVISRALARSGAIDTLAGKLIGASSAQFAHLASFSLLGALLSGFMNNVGALALLMPVALSTARRHGYSPGLLLMPLSFATLLGGTTTLIGTPPNLLISAFRAEATGERFLLFDFAPTGLAVTVAGIAYLLLVGWRLLPAERRTAAARRRIRNRRLRHRGAGAPVIPDRRPRCGRIRSQPERSCAGRHSRRPPAVRPYAGKRCCRPRTSCCCRRIRRFWSARSRRTSLSLSNGTSRMRSRRAPGPTWSRPWCCRMPWFRAAAPRRST